LALIGVLSRALEAGVPKAELVDAVLDQMDLDFNIVESELLPISCCLEELVDAWGIELHEC
jgi:hypothetical protein